MRSREQVLLTYCERVTESVRYVHALTWPDGRVQCWDDIDVSAPLYLPIFWDEKASCWVRYAVSRPVSLVDARREVGRINEIGSRRWKIIGTEVIAMIHTRRDVSNMREGDATLFGSVVEEEGHAS